MFPKFTATLSAVTLVLKYVNAETHSVNFTNNCGYGTPYLRAQDGTVLSAGENYTSDGPLVGAFTYLQTGVCGDNGENCTVIVTRLQNGDTVTDITLIPPHNFSVASGFGYFNGCDGYGADCTFAERPEAYHNPKDPISSPICSSNNVDLAVLFCD